LTTQLIVKPQHFADEAGTNLKRQGADVAGRRVGGRLGDRLTLESVQTWRRVIQPRVQRVVQLIAGDEPGVQFVRK
jgi:hypothetical protein